LAARGLSGRVLCSAAGIGSGAGFAVAAARALIDVPGMDAFSIGGRGSQPACLPAFACPPAAAGQPLHLASLPLLLGTGLPWGMCT
jgi:hypothetical protein